ncbi:MAG: trypsin-like peptidase domain-containing protein [Bacteroidetes bacterium]|nr:trypsin-like peptidase domain-containing protein [Bacteroidota bacterium]
MQEAIANTLYDELEDSAAHVIFKDDESLKASKLKALELVSTTAVMDMKSALKATVTIKTNDSFGSGCVVSNDGYILTSYHVISDSPDSTIKVITSKGDTLNCKLDRTSKMADLALLKTVSTFPFSFNLKKLVEFEVSDEVMAIGTPASMELSQTVSKGIISGVRKGSDKLTLIQTDVSVSPGNSGGPLVTSTGSFIGVVNSKISGSRVEGLGFCTPLIDVISRLNLKVK